MIDLERVATWGHVAAISALAGGWAGGLAESIDDSGERIVARLIALAGCSIAMFGLFSIERIVRARRSIHDPR